MTHLKNQQFLSSECAEIVTSALIVGRKVSMFSNSTPKPETIYVVFSWYAPHNRWKLWPAELFSSRSHAETFAKSRLSIGGHTGAVVVEIELEC